MPLCVHRSLQFVVTGGHNFFIALNLVENAYVICECSLTINMIQILIFLFAFSKLIMVKTTSAERIKSFRRRRNESDPEFKKNESKRISTIINNQRASMSEQELCDLREKQRIYMKKWREQRKSKKAESIITNADPGYKTPQTYGKALKKVKKNFPKSHKKN